MEIKEIGYLKTSFPTKFGVPRQSRVSKSSLATLIFNEEYRVPEALSGLEGYSHVWVIWGFSEAKYEKFSPTVRPPRLGGNTRVGVFASRSPFRPNSLGLSVLKLEVIEKELSEEKDKFNEMKAKLDAEKKDISSVQRLQKEIENVNAEIERAERDYDLNKAAELKYGKLPNLKKELEEAEKTPKKTTLLRNKVTEEEIEKIMSRWTGIPIS